MTEKAQQLITDFKHKGWDTEMIFERMFELAKVPADLFEFLEEYLVCFDKSSTLFDDALSYIEEEHFKKLVKQSIDILQVKHNDNAENVLLYASVQFPALLHEYLELTFELESNKGMYAPYPWRGLASNNAQYFKDKLTSNNTNPADKERMIRCLLETRNLETIQYTYNYAKDSGLIDDEWLLAVLEDVGYTIKENTIQSYCPNTAKHLVFEKNYFKAARFIHLSKEQHPTWNLQPETTTYKFGGVLADDEKNPFFHTITFPQIPDGLNISSLKQLTLGVHVTEMNENGPVFYQHDENGMPVKIQLGEEKEIKFFSDVPIKETVVQLAHTPKRWERQSWGCSNGRENLFRLGGEPTWIQNADVLTCPICNEKMDFLLQLDTDLPDINDGELMFGSGGTCYVFWCNTSKVSGYVMQCT